MVGGALVLALALAGCSSTDVATTGTTDGMAAGKAAPTVMVTDTGAGAATPSPQPSVDKVVQVGAFCADPGLLAHNADNAQVRCVKPGDARARWVLDSGPAVSPTIRPGAFCPTEGTKGQNAAKSYTCTGGSGGKARWHADN
ncbi:hypothetical protein GCM10027589_10710 [Actinocorallia lasiicapitis]